MKYIFIIFIILSCSSAERKISSSEKTVIDTKLYNLKNLIFEHFIFDKGAYWRGEITFQSSDLKNIECRDFEKLLELSKNNKIIYENTGKSLIKCKYKGPEHSVSLKLVFQPSPYTIEDSFQYKSLLAQSNEIQRLNEIKSNIENSDDLYKFKNDLNGIYKEELKQLILDSANSGQFFVKLDPTDSLMLYSTRGSFNRKIGFSNRVISANGYTPRPIVLGSFKFSDLTPYSLVCHIDKKILFSGDVKDKKILNKSGNVYCQINSPIGKEFKNYGKIRLYYAHYKKEELLAALNVRINEVQGKIDSLKSEINLWVKTHNEWMIRDFDKGIYHLKTLNENFVAQSPQQFVEEKINSEQFTLKVNRSYLRAKVGAFCSSIHLIEDYIYGLCDFDNSNGKTLFLKLSKDLKIIKTVDLVGLEGSAAQVVPTGKDEFIVYSKYSPQIYFISSGKQHKINTAYDDGVYTHYQKENLIYFYIQNHTGKKILVFDLLTKEQKIIKKLSDKSLIGLFTESYFYLVYENGELITFDYSINGLEEIKKNQMPKNNVHYESIALIDNELLLTDSNGYLYSYNLNEEKIKIEFVTFFKDKMNSLSHLPEAKGIPHRVVKLGDNFILATMDGRLYFLDENFKFKWMIQLDNFRGISGQPHVVKVGEEELLWVPSTGWNYLISSAGETRTVFVTVGAENYSNLIVDGDNFYFGFAKGIYKLKPQKTLDKKATILNKLN